jgi:hypothetical protein
MKDKKKTNLYPAVPFTRMMLEQLKARGKKANSRDFCAVS